MVWAFLRIHARHSHPGPVAHVKIGVFVVIFLNVSTFSAFLSRLHSCCLCVSACLLACDLRCLCHRHRHATWHFAPLCLLFLCAKGQPAYRCFPASLAAASLPARVSLAHVLFISLLRLNLPSFSLCLTCLIPASFPASFPAHRVSLALSLCLTTVCPEFFPHCVFSLRPFLK